MTTTKKGPGPETLKEFFLVLKGKQALFSSAPSYEEIRAPGGAELKLLETMTPEETQIFLDADLTFEEKLRKFGEGTYDLSDIDAAAADLMKEGRDLDTAAVLIPFYDEHQKQIEAAKASGNPEKILEANLALIMRVGGTAAAEDLLEIVQGPRKSGYEAALDRMHEEEVFASAFSMTHIVMKYAQDHDVDVQAVLGRVQKNLEGATQDKPVVVEKPEDQYRELAREIGDRVQDLSSLSVNVRQGTALSGLFAELHKMEESGNPRNIVEALSRYRMAGLEYEGYEASVFKEGMRDIVGIIEDFTRRTGLELPGPRQALPVVASDKEEGLLIPHEQDKLHFLRGGVSREEDTGPKPGMRLGGL